MKITKITKIGGGQDGAIHGSELFRFIANGECSVYDMEDLLSKKLDITSPFAKFKLDNTHSVTPHSNSVIFGSEYFDENDEYPLLYSNIYNNYANRDDKMMGVCLVYRLQKLNGEFKTTLVQMIEIGFCENAELWKLSPDNHGIRPYGNFVIDRDKGSYWAFVMRDEQLGTRYFQFNLPLVHDGVLDPIYNVKKVVLNPEDIIDHFDCEYHHYIQGAVLRDGKIYSTEGVHLGVENRPAIRIIDLAMKREKYYDLTALGLVNEPEFIDFYNGICYYSDAQGNFYVVDFDSDTDAD